MIRETRSSFSFGSIFTFFAYFVLTILFLVHAIICIDKFFRFGTTSVMTTQYMDEIEVPGITICKTGYKGLNSTSYEMDLLMTLETICDVYIKNITTYSNATTTATSSTSTSTTTTTTTTTTSTTTTTTTTTKNGTVNGSTTASTSTTSKANSATTPSTTTTTKSLTMSPLDAADVWNKCISQRYFTKPDLVMQVNYGPAADAFWKPLSIQADDAKWIPFTSSKYGQCFTMKPPPGKRLRTTMKDATLLLKLQPGSYTVMVHDPRVLPISAETPDTLSFQPLNINLPSTSVANGSMQYVMISMKEKQMTLPDRIDESRFGAKPCKDNDMWTDNLQKNIVKSVGCQLDMLKWVNASFAPNCKTRAEMNNYFNTMMAIERYSASDLANRLNSPPLCRFRLIDASVVVKMSTVKKDFPEINVANQVTNTGSYLMFYYDSARVQLQTDMLFYDGANLIGELGGSLALFLALSLVDLIRLFKYCGGKACGSKKISY